MNRDNKSTTSSKTRRSLVGRGSILNHQGTADDSPCVHLPGFHFGYLCFTHSHLGMNPIGDPLKDIIYLGTLCPLAHLSLIPMSSIRSPPRFDCSAESLEVIAPPSF